MEQAPNPSPGDGDDVEMPSGTSEEGSEDDDASSTDDNDGDESSLALFSDTVHFGNISNLRVLSPFDVSACATSGPG